MTNSDSMVIPEIPDERHFFLQQSEKRFIYCIEYPPKEKSNRRCGVILCKPIWGERIRTHRVFTNLARLLAGAGHWVVTCDYYGDGNSGGDTLDLSFTGMVEDVLALNKYMRENCLVNEFVLVGLRVGANVAIEAGRKMRLLTKAILIEPVSDLVNFLKSALRMNLSTQMVMHKKIIKNRETLIADIKRGHPVNVDGFLFGKKMWESFEGATPIKIDAQWDAETVFIELSPRKKKSPAIEKLVRQCRRAEHKVLEREFIWTGWKTNTPKPPQFLQAILEEVG